MDRMLCNFSLSLVRLAPCLVPEEGTMSLKQPKAAEFGSAPLRDHAGSGQGHRA